MSKMVESLFKNVIGSNNESREKLTPLVRELMGVLSTDAQLDYRKEYTDFLIKKYK